MSRKTGTRTCHLLRMGEATGAQMTGTLISDNAVSEASGQLLGT